MADRLVTVGTFGSPGEARIAVALLDAAGIDACLEGEASAVSLSHLGSGLGGVKLQVREEDAERALAALGASGSDGSESPPWTCGACGAAIDGGFDVCWSCGASRDEAAATDSYRPPPAPPDEELPPCPMCGAAIPLNAAVCPKCGELLTELEQSARGVRGRAPTADDADRGPSPARETLTHAWRASILGIGLCPPLLHIYSAALLAKYHRQRAADGSDDDWRATAAFWINALFIVGAFFVSSVVFRRF